MPIARQLPAHVHDRHGRASGPISRGVDSVDTMIFPRALGGPPHATGALHHDARDFSPRHRAPGG
jgi:hypothetical protein